MKQYAKAFVQEVKENGRITGAIASTGAVDRMGEILDPKGWDLSNFKKAPRLLWGHEARDLPIGRVVPSSMKVNQRGELLFDAEFAEKENPFAKQVADMMRANFINTFSVGFIPKKRDDHNPDVITEMELLEISVVNIPANPEALAKTAFKDFQEVVKDIEGEKKELNENDFSEEKDVAEVHVLADIVANLSFLEKAFERNNREKKVVQKIRDAKLLVMEAIRLEAKFDEEKDLQDFIAEAVKQEATEVQTVILSKKKFKELEDAKKWVKEHDFHMSKVDETQDSWRFRQFDPDRCKAGSFRTITLTEGVKAVVCRPKAGKCFEMDESDLHLMRNVIASIKELEPALGDVLQKTAPTGDKKVESQKAHKDQKVRRSLKLASRAIEIALRSTK